MMVKSNSQHSLMDPSLYKTLSVTRGLTYNYYFSPPEGGKSTLLLLHGFPASSYDWRHQVLYFKSKGFGIIAPDLLGASGKTSHPQDIALFRMSNMAADIISILDAEKVEKVVGICHDWGSVLLSRLVLLHPNLFLGSVWLGLAFSLPNQERYEAVAYWEYFVKESTPENICKNIESFMQLCYPKDPSIWRSTLVVPGKAEEWMTNGTRVGRPAYLTDSEFEQVCAHFVESEGSALCWYKSHTSDLNLEDNRRTPGEGFTLKHPSLLITALKDVVCPAEFSKKGMAPFATDLTTTELDTGHWIHIESPHEVNEAINSFLSFKSL